MMLELVVALLAAGAAVGLWYAVRLRRYRTRLHALRGRFDQLRSGIDDTTLQLSELVTTTRRDVELVRGTFAEEEYSTVLGEAPQVLARAEDLLQRRSELPEPFGKRGRDSTAATGVETWRDYGERLSAVYTELQSEERRLTAELNEAERLPQRLDDTRGLVEEVRSAIASGEEAGYALSAESAALRIAEERLAEADRLLGERRFRAAHASATEVTEELTGTRDELYSLRRRSAELDTRLAALQDAVSALAEREHEAGQQRDHLVQEYAPGVWSGVEDHVVAGGVAAQRARAELVTARDALAAGDLSAAEQALDTATKQREHAEAGFDVPAERRTVVERLRETLPAERESIRGRLAALAAMPEGDEAARPLSDVVAELHRQLDAVDLTAAKPEWLLCEWRLGEIDALVATLGALGEHRVATVRRLRNDLDLARAQEQRAWQAKAEAEAELKWHLAGRRSRRDAK